jgi:hypothetical protein
VTDQRPSRAPHLAGVAAGLLVPLSLLLWSFCGQDEQEVIPDVAFLSLAVICHVVLSILAIVFGARSYSRKQTSVVPMVVSIVALVVACILWIFGVIWIVLTAHGHYK